MKRTSLFLLLASTMLHAQSMIHDHTTGAERPVTLVKGLGNSHHSIDTRRVAAQQYFNQGLDYLFAFNHEEARRSFQKAADLDQKAPMPLWGVALAVGPNYNDIDIGHVRAQQAMSALASARVLATKAPPVQQAYVAALSARYRMAKDGAPEVMGREYSKAMEELAKKYPNDLDAATLYAESLMDLNPWKLWAADGKPGEYTELLVATLQGVLAKDPNHVGANHLLIHAVEASPDASVASASAKRLETLTPAAGHLVHMPAHIYQRTGNFNGAATANERAVVADRAYFKSQHLEGVANMYDSMYYTHNMHFLASSCSMEGNWACTDRASKELVEHVVPEIKASPGVEWYTPTQPWMLVRFNKWATILASPLPSVPTPALTGMWHYARGCAFVAQGKFAEAKAERELLVNAGKTLPSGFPEDFNNPAKSAFELATLALDARLLEAEGHRRDAIETWAKAVEALDIFAYNEPPDWYYPVRESLGGALLREHRAKDAEAVFRKDLTVNVGNGRSLYGVWQSLLMQGRVNEAAAAEREFRAAWKHADTQLSVATL